MVRLCLAGVARTLIDVIFPEAGPCTLCRRPVGFDRTLPICAECFDRITPITDPCHRCGRPIGPRPRGRMRGAATCGECRSRSSALDRGRSFGVYEGYLRERIHGLKYGGEIGAAQGLGELMAWCVARDGGFGRLDGVVPVPLHPKRREERGYNQAEALAEAVAGQLGLPVIAAVGRTRETVAQSKLSWSERTQNVRGAFTVLDPTAVRGKRLLIVDDVYTTGATADALALALKRSGGRFCGGVFAAASSLEREWRS